MGQGGVADQPCGFEAIHLRHLEVHQDDIKSVGGGGDLCGKLAVPLRWQDHVTQLLQDKEDNLLVDDIIFG